MVCVFCYLLCWRLIFSDLTKRKQHDMFGCWAFSCMLPPGTGLFTPSQYCIQSAFCKHTCVCTLYACFCNSFCLYSFLSPVWDGTVMSLRNRTSPCFRQCLLLHTCALFAYLHMPYTLPFCLRRCLKAYFSLSVCYACPCIHNYGLILCAFFPSHCTPIQHCQHTKNTATLSI